MKFLITASFSNRVLLAPGIFIEQIKTKLKKRVFIYKNIFMFDYIYIYIYIYMYIYKNTSMGKDSSEQFVSMRVNGKKKPLS